MQIQILSDIERTFVVIIAKFQKFWTCNERKFPKFYLLMRHCEDFAMTMPVSATATTTLEGPEVYMMMMPQPGETLPTFRFVEKSDNYKLSQHV